MTLLRLVFLLFFSFALDVATPSVSGPIEAFDGLEEEIHLTRARKAGRPASAQERSPDQRGASVQAVRRAARAPSAPQIRRTSGGSVRKVPPAIADSSTVPEDH
jgi:hypothetical protein